MLHPDYPPPFPLQWGFSTKLDDPSLLPTPRSRQVHGVEILEIHDPQPISELPSADGLWTSQPGCRIGVRVADCVPVLLAGLAGGRPWVATLHAGWRGAVQGIFRHGVALFVEQGGRPEDLVYAFGPSIQPCCFEVGSDVVEAAQGDAAWQASHASSKGGGKFHLDLHGLLKSQALQMGLDPGKDASLPLCTKCETDLLYSYRRGDLEGRQWGWIEIS